jgi:hypothetical protein
MKVLCPLCNDANSCGDYEGPTCEVCKGEGFIAQHAWDDIEEGFDAEEWNNVPVNVEDELHQVLGEALAKAKPRPL